MHTFIRSINTAAYFFIHADAKIWSSYLCIFNETIDFIYQLHRYRLDGIYFKKNQLLAFVNLFQMKGWYTMDTQANML